MRGPCAKRRVQCVIVPFGMAPIMGENDCANPQPTCPRLPGEGYEKCKTICQQDGHAEIAALRRAEDWTARAGHSLHGAKAFIRGHYWMCEPCGAALKKAGIAGITIVHDEGEPSASPSEADRRDAERYRWRKWCDYSKGRVGGDSIEYAAFSAMYDAMSDAMQSPLPSPSGDEESK